MGKRSDWKRSKFGDLPGDIGRCDKIAMLEGDAPFKIYYSKESYQEIDNKCAKAYKKEHIRKANRRFRRKKDFLNEIKENYNESFR